MHRLATIPAVVLACTLLLATSAAAQNWTVSIDGVVDSSFIISNTHNGKSTQEKLAQNGQDGGILSVTTPYHVGFGFENYTLHLQPGQPPVTVDFNVQMLDVFVDIPVFRWLTLTPGAGWGTGRASIPSAGGGSNPFKRDANLWQYFLVAGVPVGWGLQFRLGYHESQGTFFTPEDSTPGVFSSHHVKVPATTVGLGYTF